jgi:hypothetical protein
VAIELQCGRCLRSVSFDRVEPDKPLFCPVCKEPFPVKPSKVTEIAPLASESVPWWVSGPSVPAGELTAINPKSDAFLVFAPPRPSASDGPTVVDGPALGDATVPHEILPRPAEDRSPTRPQSTARQSDSAARKRGRSAAALLPGVLAFAVVWSPALVYLGLLLAVFGLLFSGLLLGRAIVRGRRGADFLLAAFLVNLQSFLLAVYFLVS